MTQPGWQEKTLGDVAEFVNGRPFKPYEWKKAGLPIIRIQNLNGSTEYNYYDGRYDPKVLITSGDLLFAWSGSRGTSFGPYIWKGQDGLLNYHTWKVNHSENIDRLFLFYALENLTALIESEAHGASALVHMQKQNVVYYKILIPPKPEQHKIAELLSTWEEAIAKTENLIFILRERKKGLMQCLFNCQVRFPGFTEKWKVVHLRDEFQRVLRKTGEQKVEYVLSITATVGFVDQREKFGKVIAGKNLVNYTLLQKGEYAYNKGNSKPYPQGCIYLLEEFDEGAVPNVYFSFAAKSANEVNTHFYKHYFESGALNPQLEKYISSSVRGDGLFNIAFEDFFSVKIPLPSIEEQEKIAIILDTCDTEIQLQTKILEALKQQKKGLMQKLLTGQTRVKV
jgi:type I restriction enzyme S subunit